MELKYDFIDEELAYTMDLKLPFRLTSNSKYLLGLDHLGLFSVL